MQANPTMEDGTANIPYTILCDDWRYFCLENAPQFLDGYPNDGCCMVDPETSDGDGLQHDRYRSKVFPVN